jgi:MFS family permease
MRRSLVAGVLLVAVAVVFADSAIVVLALPDLLHATGSSIGAVAWVVTAYNLALGCAAALLTRIRPSPRALALGGAATFAGATLACGVANGIVLLVALRAVQGVGGAALLVSAPSMLAPLLGVRALRAWTAAGVLGAAVGPAAGGALTAAFGWRGIFLAQAPLAGLAVLAVAASRGGSAPVGPSPRAGSARALAASVLVSAAAVALFFLSVILLVDVWRLRPLAAAAVVTAAPLGTLAAQLARRRVGPVAGALLLAGGLAGMALLPGRSPVFAVASLGLAGLGFGLAARVFDEVAAARGAAFAVAARHVGLALGLALLTPLLATDLRHASMQAKLEGIATVLDSEVAPTATVKLAVDLLPLLARPPRAQLPAFHATLSRSGSPQLTALGGRLDAVVEETVTRGFRRSFLLAAALALASGVALVRVRVRHARALALAAVLAAALPAAELARGAASAGEHPRLLPPCAPRPGARLSSKSLDALACRLHLGREQLVETLGRGGGSVLRLFGL